MATTPVTTDTPIPLSNREDAHTLSILVNNEPGVLMRIAQVFSRRGFNIDSLVVSEGRRREFSRMTIGISGDPEGLVQIIKQVNKLIDVIHCFEHSSKDSVEKELLLVKMSLTAEQRIQALQIVEHFGGKALDMTHESLIAMFHGDSRKIDSALEMMSAFEIIETVRTGKVVMARGKQPT